MPLNLIALKGQFKIRNFKSDFPGNFGINFYFFNRSNFLGQKNQKLMNTELRLKTEQRFMPKYIPEQYSQFMGRNMIYKTWS